MILLSKAKLMHLRMLFLAVSLSLGACTIAPEPFTLEENAARAAADLDMLEAYNPPPTRPISLEEAQARALTYNLDNRLQMFNAALQDRQLDLSKYDLLPNLTANAGYVARTPELVSSSASYQTGVILPSNLQTVSVDRERYFGDLTLSWNIIDFGVSYLQAKQQADRVEIAREQRRRVVNNIFQQVRSAYWTAVAAERVRPRLKPILREARRALVTSRSLETDRAQQPVEALRYQRALMELIQDLESVDDKLAISKIQLAQLMGLNPGSSYTLVVPSNGLSLPSIRFSIDQMEQMALVNRPELREEGYNSRITFHEGRRALLRLMPGVNLLASLNYDSNSYLLFNDWKEGGVRIAASLVRLLSMPAVVNLNEVQKDIAETRRLATTVAVLAQVQIAAQQYVIARKNYERASAIANVNRRIAEVSADNRDAKTSSALDLIFEKANAIVAELRRNRAYADLQNASASIYATVGLDPLPVGVEKDDVLALAAAIRERANEWRVGKVEVPFIVRASVAANQKMPADAAAVSATARPEQPHAVAAAE
jgi:outer membrane protein TolC